MLRRIPIDAPERFDRVVSGCRELTVNEVSSQIRVRFDFGVSPFHAHPTKRLADESGGIRSANLSHTANDVW